MIAHSGHPAPLVPGRWNLLNCPHCDARCVVYLSTEGVLGSLYETASLRTVHACLASRP